MHKHKYMQKGGVTILLVVLLGVAAMVATASVAYSINSKKEAGVAAHAQTNAQMMAWAGTSAFFDYIKAKGALGLTAFKAMNATTVTLKSAGGQTVVAKNIAITGACAVNDDPCTVTADISADNATSKAANTINVVYEMKVLDGTVVAAVKTKASFGGNLTVDGKIESETPGGEVELNVKGGDVTFTSGARLNNISRLTINSTGNVRINCTSNLNADSICNDASLQAIDINAGGFIEITDGKIGAGKFGNLNAKNFIELSNVKAGNLNAVQGVKLTSGAAVGDIAAGGDVTLYAATSAKNISSNSNVSIQTGSQADDVQAAGNISMIGGGGALQSSAKNLMANGDVTLSGAAVQNINARGSVSLADGATSKNIVSNKNITLTIVGTQAVGNISALGYVYMSTNAVVTGDATVRGDNTTTQGSSLYMISGAKILGNVYVKGDARLITPFQTGQIYATNNILNGIGTRTSLGGAAGRTEKSPLATSKVEGLASVPLITPVNVQTIKDAVDAKFDFENEVDVRVYRNESNYIFVKANGVSRVFLNKLKNPANGDIYSYEADGKQYVTVAGTKTLVGDGGGYYIGKYTMGGTQKYVGAICKTAASGLCASDILAYIPRVSAEDKPFEDSLESLGYGLPAADTWYVRTFYDNSTIDNATLAPGIFYFSGNLRIHGYPNIQADSTSNVYTDSFLAEGDISALLSSPRIYSPYNILRVNPDASIICNRAYKAADGTDFGSAPTTSPSSIGSKYLVPTNLCKGQTEFFKDQIGSMDKKPNTSNKDTVIIDGKNMPKLDLGYVALMSNKDIEVGECAQIFGDVLAQGKIYASKGCGLTNSSQSITGSITTEGAGGQLENRIFTGSKYIIPNEDFTGINKGSTSTVNGPVINPGSVKMKWAKSL